MSRAIFDGARRSEEICGSSNIHAGNVPRIYTADVGEGTPADLAAIDAATEPLTDDAELNAEQTGFPAGGVASAGEVVLEDTELLVALDANSGALTRMRRKSTGWVIERRSHLAVSFRLLAPLPGRRDKFVLGQKQRALKVEKLSDRQVGIEFVTPAGKRAVVVVNTESNRAIAARVSLPNPGPSRSSDARAT